MYYLLVERKKIYRDNAIIEKIYLLIRSVLRKQGDLIFLLP